MREMTDQEREREQKRLSAKITPFLGRQLGRRTIEAIEEIVADHRQRCRLVGLEFPECAVLVMPDAGNIDIVPKDLDQKGVETLIVNLARKYPTVSREDLAFAIGRAFPDYVKLISAAEKHRGWTPEPANAR